MTLNPKEKAELINSNYKGELLKKENKVDLSSINKLAIQCALIAVDERMEEAAEILPYGMEYLSRIDYLEGAKQELIKMQENEIN